MIIIAFYDPNTTSLTEATLINHSFQTNFAQDTKKHNK